MSKWTTVYVTDDALKALQDVKINFLGLNLTKNSDKILFLVNYFKENSNK